MPNGEKPIASLPPIANRPLTEASVNGLYAIAAHDAIGFSPFGIESISDPAGKYLAASYGLAAQLEPIILPLQGKGAMAGLLSEGPEQRQPQQVQLGPYVLRATFERETGPSLADGVPGTSAPRVASPSGGLVLATGPDQFIVAGTGITIVFSTEDAGKQAGIVSAEEGRYVDGRWQNIRWLGGDETHQGRHIRLEPGRFSIQRVKVYRY